MESGVSALRLDTGHTLGPPWAQDLGLAAPGPGWLAGRLAGRAAGAPGWLADWLAAWLASWLLGFSWTVRLWNPFCFFRGILIFALFCRTIAPTGVWSVRSGAWNQKK